jgi:acylphosphatase
MGDIAKHTFFSGSVQGVGFRFTARQIARSYQLAGFVRNCTDGRVEMFVQGAPEDVEGCLQELGRIFAGYIRDTAIEQVPALPEYVDFRITF